MLLCIDLGNTNITFGLFADQDMVNNWRIKTDHHKMPDEYGILMVNLLADGGFAPQAIKGVCLCSVVPPLVSIFQQALARFFAKEPLVVRALAGVKTGVKICYDNPREVGADRIVDAAAVYRLYGGPVCVVDFGTATTFDAISADGDYLGGAIVPGIGISAEALFNKAAKLPRIDLVRPPRAIGTNTVHSMQSGLLFGYAGLVEGMVARFRAEMGPNTRVVATGGLAEVMAKETDVIDEIDPWLTLRGLKIIWDMNQ